MKRIIVLALALAACSEEKPRDPRDDQGKSIPLGPVKPYVPPKEVVKRQPLDAKAPAQREKLTAANGICMGLWETRKYRGDDASLVMSRDGTYNWRGKSGTWTQSGGTLRVAGGRLEECGKTRAHLYVGSTHYSLWRTSPI